MKTLKFVFAALVTMLLATSCSKVENKLESQIPADALVVAKIDIPTLIKNLDIQVKDGQVVLPEKFAKMVEENGGAKEFKENFSKMTQSGIDFAHSIYFFVPKTSTSLEPSGVLLAPVDDAAKLKKFLSDELKVALETKDGMEVNKKQDNIFAIVDDVFYVALGYNDQDPASVIKGIVTTQKGMADNASIVRALDTDDEVNVYVDTKALKEMSSKELNNLGGQEAEMAKVIFDLIDIKSSAYHLNFADNTWNYRMSNEVDDNSDFAKMVNQVTSKPSAELLAFMPKSTNMGAINVNLNGEGIMNLDMVKKLTSQLGGDIAPVLDIVKSINGPVTLGFASSSISPEDADLALAFKCGKAQELIGLLRTMLPPNAYTQRDNEYALNDKIEGFNALLGVKDDVVYIKMTHKGYTETMSGVSEAKDVIGSSLAGGFLSLNVDGMELQLTTEGKNIKEGSAQLWVKENGKKLSPLDALTFFARLAQR